MNSSLKRFMNGPAAVFASFCFWMGCVSPRALAAAPDVASPLISYQYLDTAATTPGQSNLLSAVVSYQWGSAQTTSPNYNLIDLGTLGGTSSAAYGINNSGQVVGCANLPGDTNQHAFLYSNGSMQDLGTLSGGNSCAYGINIVGYVVGSSTTNIISNSNHAFLYSNGSMQDLGTLGGASSYAYGINDNGQIVGASLATTNTPIHAFLYVNGSMQDLDPLAGELGSANAINDSGQVVGFVATGGLVAGRAFLYANGSRQDIGTLGGPYSVANAINGNGQVVGSASTTNYPNSHAFLYTGGVMQDLDTLGGNNSTANGLNLAGQVVGSSSINTTSLYTHAFLYSNGSIRDLNDRIVGAGNWTLNSATAINDSGQIVGYGLNPSNQLHAFLLNPLPFAAQIVIGPVSQFVQTGGTATFSVVAEGQPPPAYQWQFDGTQLRGATEPSLSITNAQMTNVGNYSVIVGNAYGSTTSSVAQLVLLLQTNRVPTPAEIGSGTIPTNDYLTVFANGVFTNAPVYSNRMTIVMTHGWMDNPDGWATNMAALFLANLPSPPPNIVAWDWSKEAALQLPDATKLVRGQGQRLGLAIFQRLGPDYSMPVHFIGHSLGTLVNAAAADYLHGDGPGTPPVKAINAFLPSNTQMTLCDEAELASVATVTSVAWQSLEDYILSSLIATVSGQSQPTPPYYFKPLPDRAAWIDNYISAVGLIHEQAANVVLTNGAQAVYSAPNFDAWWSAVKVLHHYPIDWYDISINAAGNGLMGNEWSFERNGFGLAPATNSAFIQSIDSSQLELTSASIDFANRVMLANMLRELASGVASFSYSTVSAIESNVLQTVGQVQVTLSHALIQDAYAINAGARIEWSMVVNLTTGIANGLFAQASLRRPLGVQLSGSGSNITNVPAYAWIPLVVPSNAVSLSFDFTLSGEGNNDSLAAAINGSNVFGLEAALIKTNAPANTGLIDVSSWAGQRVELFLGIVGGTSTNANITVSGIRFYTVLPPSLHAQVFGPNFVISWPISAASYVLETASSLEMTNSWVTVTNAPAVVNFQNTVTNGTFSGIQFYRLRKQ